MAHRNTLKKTKKLENKTTQHQRVKEKEKKEGGKEQTIQRNEPSMWYV